jgi:hypothetical protein
MSGTHQTEPRSTGGRSPRIKLTARKSTGGRAPQIHITARKSTGGPQIFFQEADESASGSENDDYPSDDVDQSDDESSPEQDVVQGKQLGDKVSQVDQQAVQAGSVESSKEVEGIEKPQVPAKIRLVATITSNKLEKPDCQQDENKDEHGSKDEDEKVKETSTGGTKRKLDSDADSDSPLASIPRI